MRSSTSIALLRFALILLFTGFGLSFCAGCTGDLKGGYLGDPITALRIQGFAAIAALASTASLIASVATLESMNSNTKAKLVMAAVLGSAVVWFTVGWQAELQGVKQCFATQ